MTKVILFGYRDWVTPIFKSLQKLPNIKVHDIINSHEEYLDKVNTFPTDTDILLFVGWSWIIPSEITRKFLCLGIHPSDLPNYRGGSPIQHQIINGVLESKVTLMTLSCEKLDAGDIWLKEDLSLEGSSISEIFSNITESSIVLMKKFFEQYPNIKSIKQDVSEGSYFKRRTQEESKMERKDFSEKDLLYIYNYIRSLTEPYPNAFIQDIEGNKLIFTGVKYVKNES
jgi:methionyl-tRNA formyltransferase